MSSCSASLNDDAKRISHTGTVLYNKHSNIISGAKTTYHIRDTQTNPFLANDDGLNIIVRRSLNDWVNWIADDEFCVLILTLWRLQPAFKLLRFCHD